jgi:hypothetical protein
MGRPKKPVSIVKTFLAPRVLSLPELCHRLRCSRATVLRRLKDHSYYSSYNCSGRFFTIKEVVHFDSHGLWFCKGARFSRHGTLKDTVVHFVKSSERGLTHDELATQLGIRAHNTLLELVTQSRIQRVKLGPTFVYCSRKPSIHRQQVRKRKVFLRMRERPHPTSAQKIATLLELIKDPRAELQDIVIRCKRGGVGISRDVVDAIFEKYDLEKKRAL